MKEELTEERLEELEDEVYQSEDPTLYPDDVLAALWRKEWLRQSRMKFGEKMFDQRSYQVSIAVNIIGTFEKDCRDFAERKFNTQRTNLLNLADRFQELSCNLRTYFLRYCRAHGWKK